MQTKQLTKAEWVALRESITDADGRMSFDCGKVRAFNKDDVQLLPPPGLYAPNAAAYAPAPAYLVPAIVK